MLRRQLSIVGDELHSCEARAAVLYDVVQGFLSDAVDAESHRRWNGVGSAVAVERHTDVVLFRHLLAIALQRGEQAERFQLCRTQLM